MARKVTVWQDNQEQVFRTKKEAQLSDARFALSAAFTSLGYADFELDGLLELVHSDESLRRRVMSLFAKRVEEPDVTDDEVESETDEED